MDTRFIQRSMTNQLVGMTKAAVFMMMLGVFLQKNKEKQDNHSHNTLGWAITLLIIGLSIRYFFNKSPAKQLFPNEDKTIPKRFAQHYSESKLSPLTYATIEKALHDIRLPAAIMDLNAFDHNVATLQQLSKRHNKPIRIATKSIRVPALIRRALENGAPELKGVMCFNAQEAQMLYKEEKINDILIGYPTRQSHDLNILRDMHEAGVNVSLVIDSVDHMECLLTEMKGVTVPFPVLIEFDLSLRYLDEHIYLGAHRSPIRTLEDLQHLLLISVEYPCIKVIGVMAYEAIVAGLTDCNPFTTLQNLAALPLRKYAASKIAALREKIPSVFESAGMKLEIFNGGGTGSLNLFAIQENVLTEVTAGNALTCPPSVDYYSNLKGPLHFEPAAYFASPVCRSSDPKGNYPIITCAGGACIGSGAPGWDKLPVPVLPKGLTYLSDEGFGEVQTPLKAKGPFEVTAPKMVLFRPAKAGENAKQFEKMHLLERRMEQNVEIVEIKATVPTYRG
jgi:D-serine deaminase-like pyridoxal phosphate-dependent protein